MSSAVSDQQFIEIIEKILKITALKTDVRSSLILNWILSYKHYYKDEMQRCSPCPYLLAYLHFMTQLSFSFDGRPKFCKSL